MLVTTVTGDPAYMATSSGFYRACQRSSPADTHKYHEYFHGSASINKLYGLSSDGFNYWQERNLFSTNGYGPHCVFNNTTKKVSMPTLNTIYQSSYNKAYRKLVLKTKRDAIEFGLNLAEARSTAEMMLRRMTQLLAAANCLKRGDLKGFFQTLGLTYAQGTRIHPRLSLNKPTSKDMANLWLEYWLGWAPLVSDILTLAGRIVGPYNRTSVHATAKTPWERRSFEIKTATHEYNTQQKCRTKLALSADISYIDEAAYSSWDDGLNNLAQVAYGAMPVSFLLDWFINLDQLLGSITDFEGVRIKQFCISWKTEYESVHNWPKFNGSINAFGREKKQEVFGRTVLTTIPLPNLEFRLPVVSLTRVLTALSLLRSVVLK